MAKRVHAVRSCVCVVNQPQKARSVVPNLAAIYIGRPQRIGLGSAIRCPPCGLISRFCALPVQLKITSPGRPQTIHHRNRSPNSGQTKNHREQCLECQWVDDGSGGGRGRGGASKGRDRHRDVCNFEIVYSRAQALGTGGNVVQIISSWSALRRRLTRS